MIHKSILKDYFYLLEGVFKIFLNDYLILKTNRKDKYLTSKNLFINYFTNNKFYNYRNMVSIILTVEKNNILHCIKNKNYVQ